MPPSRTTDPRAPDAGTAPGRPALRFRPRYDLLLVVCAASDATFTAVGAWATGAGIYWHTPAGIAWGAALTALTAPILLLLAPAFGRRTLTTTGLTLPRAFGRRRTIALTDIANIALVRLAGKRPRWELLIWTADGTSRQTGLSARTGSTRRWRTELSGDYLAHSRAGRAATTIHAQARAAQGNDGPLTHPSPAAATAPKAYPVYWTPDGSAVDMHPPGH